MTNQKAGNTAKENEMTYRVALIWKTVEDNGSCTTSATAEGIHMFEMKQTILRLKNNNNAPLTATIQIDEENPNRLYYRNLLSSLSFVQDAA